MLVYTSVVIATPIKDVTEDHWAYQSIQKLIDQGYLSLYDDGSFKGNETITRFELAELIARLLENVESGRIAPDEEELELIRQLSLDFQDELVEIATRQDQLQKMIEKVSDDNLSQDERIAKILKEFANIEDNLSQMGNINYQQIEELNKKIAEEEEKIGEIKELVAALKEDNKLFDDNLSIIKEQIDSITKEFLKLYDLQEDFAKLKEEFNKSIINLDDFEGKLDIYLQDQITSNITTIRDLRRELDSYRSAMDDKLFAQKKEMENIKKQNLMLGIGMGVIAILMVNSIF